MEMAKVVRHGVEPFQRCGFDLVYLHFFFIIFILQMAFSCQRCCRGPLLIENLLGWSTFGFNWHASGVLEGGPWKRSHIHFCKLKNGQFHEPPESNFIMLLFFILDLLCDVHSETVINRQTCATF